MRRPIRTTAANGLQRAVYALMLFELDLTYGLPPGVSLHVCSCVDVGEGEWVPLFWDVMLPEQSHRAC